VLAVVAVAQFMVVLDASVVNVALPSIQRDVGFSEQSLSWVLNAYTLIFGGFLLLGGRAADRLGRRRLFMAGIALFAGASLACGLSQSEATLLIARGAQGLGGAMVSPAALSIILTTFAEGTERNRALAVWGAIAGAGGAVGLLLGGAIVQVLSWRWVFFVNVPIGAAVLVLAPRIVPESRGEGVRGGYDLEGATTVTLGTMALVFTLLKANDGAGGRGGRSLAWRWPPRCSSPSCGSSAGTTTPWSRCASSPTAASRPRTRRCCCSPPRSSACSSSARCICSRSSATTR
jgi:MFS family permease